MAIAGGPALDPVLPISRTGASVLAVPLAAIDAIDRAGLPFVLFAKFLVGFVYYPGVVKAAHKTCGSNDVMQVFVRDNNVEQAFRVLKKKLQREACSEK